MADDFDLDLEDDDLGLGDDLNFDMDPLAERPPAKNSREAVSNMLKDASSGFTDDIGSNPIDTAGEIAKAAIPAGLSKETDIIIDIKDKLKDEVSAATSEVKSQARGTINALEKILPKNEKVTNITNKLMTFIGDEPEVNKGPSAEEIQNANIASYITDIMGEKTDREQMEEVINHQIEANRHKSNIDLTANIATNIETIRKFNSEITNSYFRRSLELQYKSLFTAKEQLSVIKVGMDTFKNQFEAIILNTGLPDIVKTRNSEELKAKIRGSLHDSITGKYFGNDSLVGRVKKNLSEKIGATKDGILGGMGVIRDVADQKEMMSGAPLPGGKAGLAGSIAASAVKSKLGKLIGDKISSNEQAQDNIHKAKNVFMDPAAYFKGKQEQEFNEDGSEKLTSKAKNSLFSFFEDMTGHGKDRNTISIEKTDLNGVTSFDGRAHSSITKVIPGLLSKIYGEVKTIRTGGENPEDNEVAYSYNDDTFKSAKELIADVKLGVKSDVSKDSVYHIDKVIDLLVKNSDLKVDGELHKKLRKGLMSYVMDGGSLAPSNMIGEGLLDHFNSEVSDVLEASVNATLAKSKKEPAILDDLNYNLKNLKDSIPNMNAKVSELNNSGNLKVLEDMGLVTRDKITKQATFDNEKYKNFVLKEIEKTETGDIQHLLDAKAEEVDKLKEEEKKSKATYKDKIASLKDLRDKTVTKFKDTSAGSTMTDSVGDNHTINSVMDKMNIAKDDTVKGLGSKVFGKGKEKAVKLKLLTKEAEESMRVKFFESTEYKSGAVETFDEYVAALGYKLNKDSLKNTIKDTLTRTRSLDKKLFKAGKGFVKSALGFGSKAKVKLKTLSVEQEDVLRTKFFSSMEYKNGSVKTFEEYLNASGYTLNKEKVKGFLRSKLSKLPGISNLKSKIGIKLPIKTAVGKFFKKKPKEEKNIVAGKLDSLIGFLKKDKEDKKPKKNIFDSDGDGDRDGNWKDRLASKMKSKDGKKPGLLGKVAGKAGGLFGGIGKMLMMAVPAILGILGKVPKLLGGMFKAVKYIPKLFGVAAKLPGLLMKLPMLLGGVMSKLGGVGKSLYNGAKGLLTGGKAVAGKVVGKVAGKAAVTGGAALAAGAALKGATKPEVPIKKPKAGMIKSMMQKFTGPITKKLGKKAGGKVLGTLAAKVAARAVPFIGTAMLAYDGAMVAKDMISNGTSFKSAVSKQILGFDLYDKDSVAKDEDGNPIKPDESVSKVGDKKEDSYIGDEQAKEDKYDAYGNRIKKKTTPANNSSYKPLTVGALTANKPMLNKTNNLAGKSTIDKLNTKVEGDGISEDSTRTQKEPSSSGTVGEIYNRGGPYADPSGGFANVYKNGKDVDFSGFHPTFAKHLAAMANEYNELTGEKIPINSAYRSYASQLALKKKYGSKAATPGKSPHEFGLAFDTNSSVAEKLDKLGLMKKYGFTRPVGKETWHVEAIGNSIDMGAAKRDPEVAENGLLASLGKGGGGWGAGPKGSNKNRGRNTKHQMEVMGASGKEVTAKTASTTMPLKPANNVGIGKSAITSKPRGPIGDTKGLENTPTEKLPNTGVDNAPKPVKQVTATAGNKSTGKKITSIDEATNHLNKVKNDQLVKPMQNNMDLSRQANSLLSNIGNSLEQSLNVQTEMLNTLKRIEQASPIQMDAESNTVETKSIAGGNAGVGDTIRNKSTLPEPVINIKRKDQISA